MTQKTAIVTGAARGIGLATTDLFLAEGRRVAMVDRDSDILAEEAGKRDGVVALHCDVSDPDDVAKMAEDAVAELPPALTIGLGLSPFLIPSPI